MKDAFLDGLVGEWTLSGQMGDIPLLQKVSAQWVLAEQFVEMRFTQTDHDPNSDRPPYEAIYLVGHDSKSDVYVLHLFDTFGVSMNYKHGIGALENGRIEFVFLYQGGRFYNTLEQGDDEWTWLLESQEGDGRKTFATKHMTRWPSE